MWRRWLVALCAVPILLLGLKAMPVQADQHTGGDVLTGRAGAVQDGDTFDLVTAAGQTVRIRLHDIDAPEDNQPFGAESRRMLQDMLRRGSLSVTLRGEDRFGRALGDVRAGAELVNRAMVERGGAWAFEDRLSNTDYLLWQNSARRARVGLWQDDPNLVVPPWSWRRGMRPPPYPPAAPPQRQSFSASPVPPPMATPRASGFQCGTKTVCRQMTSCEEARYFLTQCGVGSLDGDNDGVPCERGPC